MNANKKQRTTKTSATRALLGERSNHGNQVPAVAPVNPKVPICGTNGGVSIDFSQAHDASISKIHRGIGVLIQQSTHQGQFTRERNQCQMASLHKLNNFAAGNPILGRQVTRFGQNGFANHTLRWQLSEGSPRPKVMLIPRAKPRHQRAGVQNERRPHRPKSVRWALFVERSVCSPLPIPAKSLTKSASDTFGAGPAAVGADVRMVSSARAFSGNVSDPHGRMRPLSNSTSSV